MRKATFRLCQLNASLPLGAERTYTPFFGSGTINLMSLLNRVPSLMQAEDGVPFKLLRASTITWMHAYAGLPLAPSGGDNA